MPHIPLSKILMPVDFSARADQAVSYATRLARRFQAELILLHVLEPVHVDYALVELPDAMAELSAKRIERTRFRLEHFATADLGDIRVKRLVCEGQPADAIVSQAEQADMVVMPTQGHSRLREFLIGSVTAKVLHDCRRPVLTGVHLADGPVRPDWQVKRILCAVDVGVEAVAVLKWGAKLAEEFGAEVTALHISSEDAPESKERLQQTIAATGVKIDLQVVSGEPHRAIVDQAWTQKAELLVIGRSSSNGALGRLRRQGYEMVRKSPCPVLSV